MLLLTGGCDEPQQSLGVSAKWIKLPFDKRFAIYDEVLQLFRRRQFRNVAALRRVIQERHKVKISYYTIHKWVRGIHDPRNRFNILTGIDANLCYIVGATLSDGHCFAHPRNRAYRAIILSVKDYGFALAFATAAKRLFRKQGNYTVSYTQERYHVKVTSVMLYDLISAGIDALRSVVERYPASFIRGFFDGDGGVTTIVSNGKLSVLLRATNSNRSLLLYLTELLQYSFGIHGRVMQVATGPLTEMIGSRRVQFNLPAYELRIDNLRHIQEFGKRIGFAIGRKQQKLLDAASLIQDYGSGVAAQKWLQLYEKRSGQWTKRDMVVSSISEVSVS